MEYDQDKVDEAILALLWLTRWEDQSNIDDGSGTRTWKGQDFGHMNRLHDKGYISDPRSKAKSVVFTEEGLERSRELFHELFGTDSPEPPTPE